MVSPDTEFISILGTATGGTESPVARVPTKSLPEILPILGLADIVIFPGMVAPLLVESAQSIRLVNDVVGGDRFVGLVLQRRPEVENPRPILPRPKPDRIENQPRWRKSQKFGTRPA